MIAEPNIWIDNAQRACVKCNLNSTANMTNCL